MLTIAIAARRARANPRRSPYNRSFHERVDTMSMLGRSWAVAIKTIHHTAESHVLMFAAALAFYTALSLAPVLILVMWGSSLIGESLQEELIKQADQLIGPEGSQTVELVVRNAHKRTEIGGIAGLFSIAALVFAATGVFAQLQTALNAIWGVVRPPRAGWLAWIRKRLISLGMIVALGFVLLVSLIASATVAFIGSHFSGWIIDIPGSTDLYRAMETSLSVVVFMLLFALVFKYLPDVPIAWRDVWVGAAVTTGFFTFGKYLIGLYLGRSSIRSAYGAAGSLVVTLVWVYYSAYIALIGAVITRASAEVAGRFVPGRPPLPTPNAAAPDAPPKAVAETQEPLVGELTKR